MSEKSEEKTFINYKVSNPNIDPTLKKEMNKLNVHLSIYYFY